MADETEKHLDNVIRPSCGRQSAFPDGRPA
jgi:hypothetical protein